MLVVVRERVEQSKLVLIFSLEIMAVFHIEVNIFVDTPKSKH